MEHRCCRYEPGAPAIFSHFKDSKQSPPLVLVDIRPPFNVEPHKGLQPVDESRRLGRGVERPTEHFKSAALVRVFSHVWPHQSGRTRGRACKVGDKLALLARLGKRGSQSAQRLARGIRRLVTRQSEAQLERALIVHAIEALVRAEAFDALVWEDLVKEERRVRGRAEGASLRSEREAQRLEGGARPLGGRRGHAYRGTGSELT